MAELVRRGPSESIPGVGYVRVNGIHTVPDEMVESLLASGEWEEYSAPKPSRLTEVPTPTPTEAPFTAEGMTMPELRELLDERDIQYAANTRKADLIDLLEGEGGE